MELQKTFEWTEEAIHQFVIDEVGCDIIFPRGYQILLKVWVPPKENEFGLIRSDLSMVNDCIQAAHGRILRMGDEAFKGIHKFPNGPRCKIGDFMIFRAQERQLVKVDDVFLALINDDRFLAKVTEPNRIQTTFDLAFQHIGS